MAEFISDFGGLFKTSRLQYIDSLEQAIAMCTEFVRAWDLALTKNVTSDDSAGVLLGMTAQQELIILHAWHKQTTLPEVEKQIIETLHRDKVLCGQPVRTRLEGEKAGIGALQYILEKPEVRPYTIDTKAPKDSKVARALPFAARVEAAVIQYFKRFTRTMARYAAIAGIIQFAWRHRQHNHMFGVLHDDGVRQNIKRALLPPKSISVSTPAKQIGKRLAVNYQSQWDADARTHSGDCGVTCIEMLVRTRGMDMSTDDLYARYLPDKPAGKYTLGWELMHVLRAQRFTNSDRTYNTNPLHELREAIDQDKAIITLVNYRYINQYIQILGYDNNFTGAHWFLVVGYDDDHMLVHDPNFGLDQLRAEPYRGKSPRKVGAYLMLPNAIFRQAWANPNTGNNPWFGIEVRL